MPTHKGIRFHQYLDNWRVRARSLQVCLQHIRELVRICPEAISGDGDIRAGTHLNRLPVSTSDLAGSIQHWTGGRPGGTSCP